LVDPLCGTSTDMIADGETVTSAVRTELKAPLNVLCAKAAMR
jgi:hypothetical protein